MCVPLAAAVIGSAVVGAGVSVYQGAKMRSAQNAAQRQNVQMAEAQAKRSENQFNKLNQKQPGIAALMQGNRSANSRGLGSTFLTGPSGVTGIGRSLGGGPSLLGG